MRIISTGSKALCLAAVLAVPATGNLAAQELDTQDGDVVATVYGAVPADLDGFEEGPEIDGFISARNGEKVKIMSADGTSSVVNISEGTVIKSRGGFLGLDRDELSANALYNGLPVSVETVSWGNGLIASRVDLKSKDLRTAAMIQRGTAQGFAEQTAATDALRNRVANIDEYNIKGTTNVYFDTGRYNLSSEARAELCQTASQAQSTDNALLLVVGYTDSTGSYEINQELSEKRAERVVNYLQQQCGWKPYRMLTPTGMAESDPAADNTTAYGKAQNRRVAVNILVSKAVEGI